jgi:hypothetical protein
MAYGSPPYSIGSYLMPRRKGAAPRATALAKQNPTFAGLMQMYPQYITGVKKPVKGAGIGGGGGGTGGGGGGTGGGGVPSVPALTPEQQAAAIVAAQLDPQIKTIIRLAQQKTLAGQAAVESATRVAQAYANLSRDDPARIQSAYNTTANFMRSASEGLTGAVGEAAQAQVANENAKLAALGLNPNVSSQGQGAFEAAQFAGGYLPATGLAAEAASAFTGAQQQGRASQYALLTQGLQEQGLRNQEANDLAQKIIDLDATRPGLTAQALATLQDMSLKKQQLAEEKRHNVAGEKVQSAAAKAQIQSINRAWYQTQLQNAKQMSDLTGRLYVVNSKGQVVPAGQKAPGSKAGQIAQTAKTAAMKLAYTKAQDTIQNALAQARIDISAANSAATVKREAAYEAWLTWKKKHPGQKATGKNNPGGLSDATVKDYRKTIAPLAYTLFNGQINEKFDPSNGVPGDPGYKPDPKNPYYSVKPVAAAEALKMLLTYAPYSLVWPIIKQYASMPNSHWIDALSWHKQPAVSPGGPGKK